MDSIDGWRRVLDVKRRRVEQRDDAVRRARADLAACESEAAAGEAAVVQRDAAWHAARNGLRQMLGERIAFRPEAVLICRHHIAEREEALHQARHELQRLRARASAACAELASAASQLQKARQQQEMTREALETAIAVRAREADDTQDEESEEAAAALMVARARGSAGGDDARSH